MMTYEKKWMKAFVVIVVFGISVCNIISLKIYSLSKSSSGGAALDNNSSISVVSNSSTLPQLDLVVILHGQLGNNLLKIAYGKIVQCFALEEGMFNFSLRFVSQGLQTSESARKDLEQCFSKHLSSDKVNLGEWKLKSVEWEDIVTKHSALLQRYFMGDGRENVTHSTSTILTVKSPSLASIRLHLEQVQNVLHWISQQNAVNESHHDDHTLNWRMQYNLSFPVVISYGWANTPLMDQYWDVLSEFFTFTSDDQRCCNSSVLPEVDETILHIRGFNVEIPNFYQNGFRELDPNQISNMLRGHLSPGDKVAIISRFDQKQLANFSGALLDQGLQVRFITHLSGVQGFCFLKSTSKELVGTLRSTYFRMAFMLNDLVSNVTAYCIEDNGPFDCNYHVHRKHSITNKKLARIHWNTPIFQSNVSVSSVNNTK